MPIGTNHVDMRGRGPNPASDERGREPAVVRVYERREVPQEKEGSGPLNLRTRAAGR